MRIYLSIDSTRREKVRLNRTEVKSTNRSSMRRIAQNQRLGGAIVRFRSITCDSLSCLPCIGENFSGVPKGKFAVFHSSGDYTMGVGRVDMSPSQAIEPALN